MEVTSLILLIVTSLGLVYTLISIGYYLFIYQYSLSKLVDELQGYTYKIDYNTLILLFVIWLCSLTVYLELMK